MTAPQTDATADPQSVVAALQQRLDAALAREATLAEELAAHAAALAEHNTAYSEQMEHQAATIDVLKAMSASPGDPQPVFDLIVRHATALCDAPNAALFEYDSELVHLRSSYRGEAIAAASSVAAYTRLFPMHPTRGSFACRAILDRQIVHIRDVRADPELAGFVRELGHGSHASVPLIRHGLAIGVISIGAPEPGGFSDSQIALLQTFAEQAVIAITSAETYRALQTRTSDLQETLEYQTATSDVLKVISHTEAQLDLALETLVATAARICAADQGAIHQLHDGLHFVSASFGTNREYRDYVARNPIAPGRGTAIGRMALERRAVHIEDVLGDPEYTGSEFQRLAGFRSVLAVPLFREDVVIGSILLTRSRVEPFTDKQIALVRTFADQAVIAIENARLITETREALERQTATAEVLGVINASPGNLVPVFDAILEKATQLCGSDLGILLAYDGGAFKSIAWRDVPPPFVEFMTRGPLRPGPTTGLARMVLERTVVHIPDMADGEAYQQRDPLRVASVELGGMRSFLAVPLAKDEALLGAIVIYRRQVSPFSDKQIALLENFAAQAVIAMENARLLTGQQEALEQQTATAEVLQVINASPGNLAPVFDAILEKAARLCEAEMGTLWTYDGEYVQPAAMRGAPPSYAEFLKKGPHRPNWAQSRVLRGERVIHTVDVEGEGYRSGDRLTLAGADLGGIRTLLVVPLRKDEAALGTIGIYRQEVRPFTDKQIALLENFAAQAVIAMENARLLTETREALEQQTATAEVLQVINSSPGDLAPVFDAMLEKAIRLCGGDRGVLWTIEGGRGRLAAARGLPAEFVALLRERGESGTNSPLQRVVRGEWLIEFPDTVEEFSRSGDPHAKGAVEAGVRSAIWVAIVKEGVTVGAFAIGRSVIGTFSDKQIALLQNFGAQAVIAMENARLLGEIRQRQQELHITFDNMVDGVAMFDEGLHLAAWNRNFQELLDVPEEFLADRPAFNDYIRYLTDRGEFAEIDAETQIKRLRGRLDKHYSFERTRPDGTVIEVRHNPMPDGGVVLIFSDITERKRNEAEIRAARDAAETAYRDLRAAQANLIQAEKMASLGQLTAGIAHEIKNPLNFVNNFAELSGDLLDELNNAVAGNRQAEIDELTATLHGNLAKITEHGRRADGIVKAMLEHSRGSSGERRMVDLNALIDEALNLAYHGARAQDQTFNITLERDFGEGIAPIEINPQDMTRVFLNIFSNGFYAATGRARDGGDAGFVPTVTVTTSDAGDAVEIRVRDNGIGIPADIRDKLFQPFFTTKATGEGTGLGLSITYDIVTKAHGGSIDVESNVGQYSEFIILP